MACSCARTVVGEFGAGNGPKSLAARAARLVVVEWVKAVVFDVDGTP
jgi:hypothetical protein